jgi:hypothetical protein
MTQMRQKSASRAPINDAEPSHPAPKLLLPFRQHPNPLISKQTKINQRNSRIFKAKNNGVSYDHRLLLPISLNRNLPIGFVHAMLALPLRGFAPIRSHSRLFAVIRAYSQSFAPIRSHSRLFAVIRAYSQSFAPIRSHSRLFAAILRSV